MDNTTWNKSFHGGQEIVADKFQLCARHAEAQRGPIVGTPHLLRLRQRCRLRRLARVCLQATTSG